MWDDALTKSKYEIILLSCKHGQVCKYYSVSVTNREEKEKNFTKWQKREAARYLLRKTTSLSSLPLLCPDPLKIYPFLLSLLSGMGIRKPGFQLWGNDRFVLLWSSKGNIEKRKKRKGWEDPLYQLLGHNKATRSGQQWCRSVEQQREPRNRDVCLWRLGIL